MRLRKEYVFLILICLVVAENPSCLEGACEFTCYVSCVDRNLSYYYVDPNCILGPSVKMEIHVSHLRNKITIFSIVEENSTNCDLELLDIARPDEVKENITVIFSSLEFDPKVSLRPSNLTAPLLKAKLRFDNFVNVSI